MHQYRNNHILEDLDHMHLEKPCKKVIIHRCRTISLLYAFAVGNQNLEAFFDDFLQVVIL